MGGNQVAPMLDRWLVGAHPLPRQGVYSNRIIGDDQKISNATIPWQTAKQLFK
jgi:hypothetical protein